VRLPRKPAHVLSSDIFQQWEHPPIQFGWYRRVPHFRKLTEERRRQIDVDPCLFTITLRYAKSHGGTEAGCCRIAKQSLRSRGVRQITQTQGNKPPEPRRRSFAR
jgi:hypothetical protein